MSDFQTDLATSLYGSDGTGSGVPGAPASGSPPTPGSQPTGEPGEYVPAPYEAFQLPEGASIDDAQSRELTELELPHLQALQYEIVQLGLALDAGIVERVADFAPEVFDKLRQLDRLRAEARRLDQAILSLTGHRFETVRDHSPIFEFPSPLVGRIRAKLHQLAEDVAAETGGRARA